METLRISFFVTCLNIGQRKAGAPKNRVSSAILIQLFLLEKRSRVAPRKWAPQYCNAYASPSQKLKALICVN